MILLSDCELMCIVVLSVLIYVILYDFMSDTILSEMWHLQ